MPKSTASDQRLRRLRALVERHTASDLGRCHTEHLLAQDSATPPPSCPRFAGVIAAEDEGHVIVAETRGALAAEMASHVLKRPPKLPVAIVDLDSDKRGPALLHPLIVFPDDAGATSSPTPRLLLVVISHRHGDDYSLVSTEEEALAYVHGYVSDWWSYERERGIDLPARIPKDAEQAVDLYFEKVGESWGTEPVAVPQIPVPPRRAGMSRPRARRSSEQSARSTRRRGRPCPSCRRRRVPRRA
jgi:hypothetical protein